ncbi:MAG: enoyl-CoA hydratase-related protein [Acidimicrobiales bacterium]
MSFVLSEITDRVATITLNDPDRRNAVNLAMNGELIEELDRIESENLAGAVVVTGAGSAFSAGADLNDLLDAMDHDEVRRIYGGFLRLANCGLPTIAAVNGPAVGAGMNLALACDVIVAGRSARFDSRFVQIGLHPGGGHIWRLAGRCGTQAAAAMVLFGQTLDGAEAERVGLAWRCVDDDALLTESTAIAAKSAGFPTELVRRAKRTLDDCREITEAGQAVEMEAEPQAWSMGQPEFSALVAKLRSQISSG